jgi:hypothetical protein
MRAGSVARVVEFGGDVLQVSRTQKRCVQRPTPPVMLPFRAEPKPDDSVREAGYDVAVTEPLRLLQPKDDGLGGTRTTARIQKRPAASNAY